MKSLCLDLNIIDHSMKAWLKTRLIMLNHLFLSLFQISFSFSSHIKRLNVYIVFIDSPWIYINHRYFFLWSKFAVLIFVMATRILEHRPLFLCTVEMCVDAWIYWHNIRLKNVYFKISAYIQYCALDTHTHTLIFVWQKWQ